MAEFTRNAWAIEFRAEHMNFAGVGWFGWPKESHLNGCRVALFTTRREARQHLPTVKRAFKRARVVPITLTIRERTHG